MKWKSNMLQWFRGNSLLHRKYIISILIVAVMPMLLVSIVVYLIGARQIRTLGMEYGQLTADWMTNTFSKNIQDLETAARYWSYNQIFAAYMEPLQVQGTLPKSEELSRVNAVIGVLSSIENSNDLIGDVEIFLEQGYTLSPFNGYAQVVNPERLEQYQALFNVPADLYWYYDLDFNALETEEACILAQKIPAEASSPIGVLMLRIDQRGLNELIEEIILSDKQYACVYLESGEILSEVGDTKYREAAEAFIEEGARQDQLSYANEFNAFVSYGNLSIEGWNYLVVMSAESYLQPLRQLVVITIGIVSLAAAVLFLITRKISYRLYHPIERLANSLGDAQDTGDTDELVQIENSWKNLTQEKNYLQEKIYTNQQVLRKQLIYQMLLGQANDISKNQFNKFLQDIGLSSSGWMCTVVYIRVIDTSASFFKVPEDDGLIGYAVANAIEYLTIEGRNFLRFDVINLQNLSTAVVVWVADSVSVSMVKKRLQEYCYQIGEVLSCKLKLIATITYGKMAMELKDVPMVFDQVKLAAQLHNPGDTNNVFDAEETVPSSERAIPYPYDVEHELFRAIHLTQEVLCRKKLDEFFKIWISAAEQEAQWFSGCCQLIWNISNDIMRSGYNFFSIYHKPSLEQDMPKVMDDAVMANWFWDYLVYPYMLEIQRIQDNKTKHIVNQVIQGMEANYRTDLSLDLFAEIHGMSSFSLSRAFKRITGYTFVDYLTGIRLQKAKELLTSTDMQISAVAEAVGYQPSYFNRVFRKNMGITPGEYRSQYNTE